MKEYEFAPHERFWVVYRIQPTRNVSAEFRSYTEARRKAEEWAKANPGIRYYVLGAKANCFVTAPLTWTNCTEDPCPF